MHGIRKKNLGVFLLVLSLLLSACAMHTSPTVTAPPIDLKELDPFYLSFLKEQCRGYSLKEGTPDFDACLLRQANANRDVTMYKYSDQYRKRVAQAMKQMDQTPQANSQTTPSQAPSQNSAAVSTKNEAPMVVSADVLSQVKACDQLESSPEVRTAVIGKLLVANEQSDNKLDLLANRNHISAEQKPLVKAFAREHYACFSRLDKGIPNLAVANAVSEYMNSTDELLAKLYGGDISIAEANRQFLKVKALRDNALMRLPR